MAEPVSDGFSDQCCFAIIKIEKRALWFDMKFMNAHLSMPIDYRFAIFQFIW